MRSFLGSVGLGTAEKWGLPIALRSWPPAVKFEIVPRGKTG